MLWLEIDYISQKIRQFLGNFNFILGFVAPTGIEPVPKESESFILSIKLRSHDILKADNKLI